MLQREHSAIPTTFIKLPVVIKIIVLSIFTWPFNTDFTVSRIISYEMIENSIHFRKISQKVKYIAENRL